MDGAGQLRIADLRRHYADVGLAEADLAADPFEQFGRWLADSLRAQLVEPNAMVLATADDQGRPSVRTVLLKGFDARGFVFFTNLASRKSQDIASNPHAALDFPWYPLERQVVARGPVERVSRADTEQYFRTRPRGSQLGAWASRQSEVVASRAELDERFAAARLRWPEDTEVPVPEFWGGLRVVPDRVEFWQGRPSRLHDRLEYRRDESASGGWTVARLAP